MNSPGLDTGRRGGAPSVLVLLAAHQGIEHLSEQLSTILNQQGVRPRVLISVDRSSDGTEALVDEWASRDPQVQTLPHGRRFGAAAPNFYRLIGEADPTGFDYVALSDQDDIWQPDKLARAVAALHAAGADGYSSNVTAWHPETGIQKLVEKAQPQTQWDYLFGSAGPGCTYVLPRSSFERFASWLATSPEAITIDYHDWLIYAWARSQGRQWIIDPVPTMLYRQHNRNQLGANQGVRQAWRRVQMLNNGWFLCEVMKISQAVGAADAYPIRLLQDSGPKALLRWLRLGTSIRRSRLDSLGLTLALALQHWGISRADRTRR